MGKFIAICLVFCLIIGTVWMIERPENVAYAGDLAKVNTMEELEEVFSELFAENEKMRTGIALYGVEKSAAPSEAATEDFVLDGEASISFDTGDLNTNGVSSTASASSKTNTQVEGVDEADIVKTDGEYIYLMSDKNVYIYDKDLEKVAQIKIDREQKSEDENIIITNMYVDEGVVTLIAERYEFSTMPIPRDGIGIQPIGDAELPEMRIMADKELKVAADIDFTNGIYRKSKSFGEVYSYEVANGEVTLVGRYGIEGNITQTRKIGDILYVVSNYYPQTKEEILPCIITKNEEAKDSEMPEEFVGRSLPLEVIEYYPGEKGNGYSIITAMNLRDGETTTKAVVHRSGEIYMNKQELFIAETVYDFGNTSDDEGEEEIGIQETWNFATTEKTRITRFEIDGMEIGEGECGEVPGTMLNQFSMDSHAGALRIATTTHDIDWNPQNNVFVMDTENMEVVGSIEGLAEGENIYAVRFMGDVGYVVTYETIDPLFVIDLSGKTNPVVTGELKIPGFSNYLHPISDKYLLGIGQDTQEIFVEDRETGEKIVTGVRTNGMKISLFNIEDMQNPFEEDVYYLGYNGTYSEVTHNHKALLVHDGLFGFDVNVQTDPSGDWDGLNQEAFLFTVTDKIVPVAELPANGEHTYMSRDDWFSGNRLCIMQERLFYLENATLTSYDLTNFAEIESIGL